jgi:PAS domain S-box-containing protein
MSKKQINNRLNKLFDDIKEEEKATQKAPRGKPTPPPISKRKPDDTTPVSLERQRVAEETLLAVDVDHTDTYAAMSLPLRVDTESWATLRVLDESPERQWDEEEQMLVQQVTEQLSLALENARLFQESQRRAEELALINRIVTEVSSSLDIQENLQVIAKEVAQISSALHVGIALLNDEKTHLTLIADYPENPADLGLKIPLENNPSTIQVLQTKKPYSLPDIQHNPLAVEIRDVMKQRGTESLVIFPILAGNEAIGTLGVDFDNPQRVLPEDKIDLIQTILLQASTSIETARFFQETQLSEARARVVVQNAPEAIVMIDMETGLFIEPNENALRLFDLSREEILQVGPADISPPAQPDGQTSAELMQEKIEIALNGEAPVFEWVYRRPNGKEIPCEIRLVQLPDATRTLIRASIVDIAERKHNELLQAAVSDISNAALNANDLKELFTEIHHIIGTLMPADNFYFALYDDVRDLITFPYHVDEIDTDWEPLKPGKGLTGYVLRTGEALLATREIIEELESKGELELLGVDSHDWLGVPLKSGKKKIGVIVVQTYDKNIQLTERHRDTLAFVGRQISSALESKQSELELRALFSAMEDVIFVVDKDTRYLRIAPTNPGGLYRPPDELLGKRMDEILPEETYLYFRSAIEQALESDKAINIEYSLDIEGKEIWFYASLSKLAENQVYWIARDITERKQAELQVQRLGNAVEQSLDGMAIADMDGYIEFVNPAWAEMHGYETTEELIGKHLSVFHTPEQLKTEVNAFNEVVQREGSNQGEIGHKRKDGSIFPTWMTVGVLKSVEDKPIALVASAQDITERKKNEEILRRQNEYMAAAAEVGRLVTSTLDTEILFKRAVNLLREHFGYYHAAIFTTEEAGFDVVVREATGDAGKAMKEKQHSLKIGSKSVVGLATETGEPYVANDVSQDPNHHFNPLLPDTKAEIAIPLKIGRRVIGALDLQATEVNAFSPEDITVLQMLTDQFATAIDNARSYQLAQDAFLEMRELEKLKSQFLANMSHELRTPLNSIIGFSRVILKGIDGPVTDLQQQDLTAIYNSGQHLLGLINDILDLSKIEAGKMELTFDEVDIEKLIKSVMSTVVGLVKDKPVRLEEEIEVDLPPVKADPMRVRQILINLFSNAAKFTDEGTIKVTAKAMGSFVRISVIDSGPGISKEDQEKLFQAFSQVDASATRATGGSGLGLSISKELVTMHGGEIGLHSEVGKGSEFYFTLPFHQNTQAEEEPLSDLPVILAIDDDEKVIDLYKRYLNTQGYQVIALTDPKKAVERAKALNPYAITLDIMMPDYDGWQVLKEIKSDAATQHIPTIICSIIEDTEKGYALGAADYLLKPILDNDLVGALDRLNKQGEIYDILLVDDDPNDLRLLEKLLEENENYHPILAESGTEGWEKIVSRPPHAVVLDLFMPEMDGFEIIEAMQSSPELKDIPVIVVSSGDLSPAEQEKLDSWNLHLHKKGSLNPEELMETLQRTLNKFKEKSK